MSSTRDGTTNRGHMAPRHVWVAPDGRWHEKCPGVAWDRRRSESGGWEYLVTWATGGGNVSTMRRDGWVSSALIRKLDEMQS